MTRAVVLRLGHRPGRDARLTTHVCLTARTFGADEAAVTTTDRGLERCVADVAQRFGGDFVVRTGVSWRTEITRWKQRGGAVVHLTMYGQPLDDVSSAFVGRDVMFVVGSEKVPGDLYGLADWNVAVGNQPHSEVAALAIALDRWSGGRWKEREFAGRLQIRPNARGKTLIEE